MTASESSLHTRFAALRPEAAGEGFQQVHFTALGSACGLFFHAPTVADAEAFVRKALHWLARFEARWSRYLPDSHLSLINARAGTGEWTETDPELEAMLALCDHYHFSTRGIFDATSLPLSRLWDWRKPHPALPVRAEVEAARALVGWEKVERGPGRIRLGVSGMQLDLGGVGKEFAVDCLTTLAKACGITRVMVDLGGDIAVLGEPPEGGSWYIGLEDPADPGRTFCGIRLRGGWAVATSGDYRRRFEVEAKTYGHIIDSRTGWPVAHGTRACTVIANRCTTAGLLSTTAMVLGGLEAIALLDRTPGVEGCLWHRGRLCESRGFRRAVLPAGWEDEAADGAEDVPNEKAEAAENRTEDCADHSVRTTFGGPLFAHGP
ncbi:MAG: ApbE family lipoprotein [Verrucomicrobiales bacterium]|nr:ApbE family lipoprotein [Verrucomicrobiales bacterium]